MFSSSQRVKRLQSVIEKDGSNQGAHFMLGEEYLREEFPMKAAAKFRRVIELNPDHAAAWAMMGKAYTAAGVYKEAAVAFDHAARKFDLDGRPTDADTMRRAAQEVRSIQ